MAGFADRPQALSASGGMLNLWDLDTGALVGTIGEPGGPSIYALAVTEQNGRQAIFAQDEELRIWDVEAGSQRTFGTAPWPTPILLAVAADGLVVCGSARMGGMDDKSLNTFEEIIEFNALQVWDLRTGRMLRTLEGNPCGINALVTTPDGHHVISGTNFGLYVFQDDSLRMWDVRSGKLERSFKGHSRTGALAVTPDQQILVSGGAFLFGRVGFDFSLKIQALKTGELIAAIPKHTGPVVGLATTRDSHWAVSAAGAWDDMAQKPRRSFREGSGEDATVRVWDLEKGTLIATFHGEDAGTCLILANDQTIVAGSRNGAVHFLRFNR